MPKTILITGATDGIGLEAAKRLASEGHLLLMHGRSAAKLTAARKAVGGTTEGYLADMSRPAEIRALAREVAAKHTALDALINNAGVYKAPQTVTPEGLDLRFMVNTIAPYMLTRDLLSAIPPGGRVVNLSSAAQAPVDLDALRGAARISDMEAYAQSKLALTMWSRLMAEDAPEGPVIVAVNPGSLLASKMVKEGFGVAGSDLGIGARVLRDAALSDGFATASGAYFDNDAGRFGPPHPHALDDAKARPVLREIEAVLARLEG